MVEVRRGIANIELVQRALGAPIEGRDLIALFRDDDRWAELQAAYSEGFTDDCEFVWIAHGQRDRDRRGAEGMRAGWLEWFEPWAEYRSELDEVRPVGNDKVIAFARQIGTREDGTQIEMPGAALITIRDDRISSVAFYARPEEAIEAAEGRS
jgi:ketosteroid isomerase-like protein